MGGHWANEEGGEGQQGTDVINEGGVIGGGGAGVLDVVWGETLGMLVRNVVNYTRGIG